MHTTTSGANSFSEALFQRSLPILILEQNMPLTAGMFLAECSQAEPDYLQIVGREELLRMKHFDMRKGCRNVIPYEPLIEGIVLARRVMQHTAVEWSALVPQAAHG